jgi:RNA recognition motif-containing protein
LKKYGTVLSITIPRPPPPKPKETPTDFDFINTNALPTDVHWGVGKVFVEFSKKEEAKKANGILSHRKFNGRTCITGYYPEDKYAAKNFLPDDTEEKAVADRFKREREEKEKIEIEKARQEAMEEIAEMEMLEKMNKEADAREQREREQREQEEQPIKQE